nr:methyltransferase domain-containing protein [Nonomuraea indica]
MHLTHASVEQLPSFGDPLDAILAVKSVGFWPDPVERLGELRRLLRPAGRIALVSQPRRPGATRDTTARAAQELQDMLTLAVMTADSTPTGFPASLRLISSGVSCGGAAPSHPTFRPRSPPDRCPN